MKNNPILLDFLFPIKQLIIVLIGLLIVNFFVLSNQNWILELSIFIVLQYLTLILVRHSFQVKIAQQTRFTPLIKLLALGILGGFSLIIVFILFFEKVKYFSLFQPINILNIINLLFLILASFFVQKKPLFQIEKLFDFDIFLFLNNCKNAINFEYQKAFLWVFGLSLLICSYFIFSLILFPDDYATLQASLEKSYGIDHNGRWLRVFLYNNIFLREFRVLSSFSMIIAYFFATLSGLLIAYLFEVKRLSALILLGLTFNLNPFLNYSFSYSNDTWHTCLAIFFSVLGGYLIIKKTRQYFLIAIILFVFSCSLNQINLIFSVLIVALWFLYQLIYIQKNNSLIKLIIQTCGYFLVILVSFIIAHYLSKVYFFIANYQAGGRLAESFFSFDFNLLTFRLSSIFGAFIQLEKIKFIPPLLFIILIFMALFTFLYTYLIYAQKYFDRMKSNHQKLFLLLLNIILLPILFNIPELIGVKIPQIIYLHYFTIGLYLVLAFYALYQFIYLSHRKSTTLGLSIAKTVLLCLVLLSIPILIFSPKLLGLSLPLHALYASSLVLFFLIVVGLQQKSGIIKNIALISSIGIIIQSSLWLNLYAFKANLQTQNDLATAQEIITRIRSNPKFDKIKEPFDFYIVGTKKLSVNSWNLNRQAFATDWSKYEVFKQLFYFNFNQIKQKNRAYIDNQLFLGNVQSFPAYNSIQIIDNTVVLVLDPNQINPSFELKKRLMIQSKFLVETKQHRIFYNTNHNLLILHKQNCTINDQSNSLFLKLYPQNINHITSYNKTIFKTFNYELFHFATVGKYEKETCLYSLKLPQYKIAKLVLGQNNKNLKWDKPLWQIELKL